MARRKTEQLTPLELEIMSVLWEIGAAKVQTVQQRLERELAYTTRQRSSGTIILRFGGESGDEPGRNEASHGRKIGAAESALDGISGGKRWRPIAGCS